MHDQARFYCFAHESSRFFWKEPEYAVICAIMRYIGLSYLLSNRYARILVDGVDLSGLVSDRLDPLGATDIADFSFCRGTVSTQPSAST